MKERENMIVVTDPRPWKIASDQEFPPRRKTSVPFSAVAPGGGAMLLPASLKVSVIS